MFLKKIQSYDFLFKTLILLSTLSSNFVFCFPPLFPYFQMFNKGIRAFCFIFYATKGTLENKGFCLQHFVGAGLAPARLCVLPQGDRKGRPYNVLRFYKVFFTNLSLFFTV